MALAPLIPVLLLALAFGANIATATLNNWTIDPSMEGSVIRLRGNATGGGPDVILNDGGARTDFFQTIGDGFFDGATVRVYRTVGEAVALVRRATVRRYLASPTSGYRIELAGSGPPVQAGDLYILELAAANAPVEKAHDRVSWVRQWDTWAVAGPGVTTRDPTTAAPENGGGSSLRITATGSGEVSIRQYRYGAPDSTYPSFEPGRTYRMEAWLKQADVADGQVRFRMSGSYAAVQHRFDVNGSWARYRFDFVAPARPPSGSPIGENILAFTGPGTVWVDNLVVYDPAYAPFAASPGMVAAFTEFRPGTMRIWSGQTNVAWGTSMANWTDPEALNVLTWDPNSGRQPAPTFKLPTALRFAQQTGATPWLIAGLYFREEEWLDLIEYLAGPTGTAYGDKRAAQGQPTPWTDVFPTIRIELANETWNPLFYPWNFDDPAEYGRFAEYFFSIARSSPYFAAVSDRIELVVNGWIVQTNENGYGPRARRAAPSSRVVDVTAYVGGWEAGGSVGGSTLTDAGFQDTLLFGPRVTEPYAAAHAATRDRLAAAGVPYALAVYEGGPGYGLPSPSLPYDPVQEQYGKSLAAAVATLDSFLINSSRGFGPQAFFLFQPGYNWSSHALIERGYQPHACWLALEMRNRLAAGDLVLSAINSAPTVDLAATDGTAARSNVPLVAAYTFRDGDRYTVFVLSRRLSDSTPVTLRLPFDTAAQVTRHRLTGDPRANNVDAAAVQVETMRLAGFANPFTFTMPPGSVYAFVFEHTETLPLPAQPSVTIAQGVGQADPTSFPQVTFSVLFSEPVSGFGGADVVLGGTASPAHAVVTEIEPFTGTTYAVAVSGMRGSGTVTVAVPAGAATAGSGNPSQASTSLDDTVTFTEPVPQHRLLVFDDFDTVSAPPPHAPFLNGVTSGAGWEGPWVAQNFDAASYVDGYRLGSGLPPRINGLAHAGGYAEGGRVWETAWRPLDVAGALAGAAVIGRSPAVVGQTGTSVWMSVVLRKNTDDVNPVFVQLLDGSFGAVHGDGRLGVGFFGSESERGGVRYWSLRVRDAAGTGWDVVRSTAPVQIGAAALLVVKMEFGVQDRVVLFVNPEPVGGPAPAAPNAIWETATDGTDIVFRTLAFYGGNHLGQAAVDEIRFGDSFEAVTPSESAAARLSGVVRHAGSGEAVAAVEMRDAGGGLLGASDATGRYALSPATAGGWAVVPHKAGDVGAAVSALDASYALQSAVGLRVLDPLQALACDVTGDGTVSALDAARILQWRVGLVPALPVHAMCGGEWAFVPETQGIPGITAAAPLLGAATCTPGRVGGSLSPPPGTVVDFTAVVFGDCTLSWQP